MLIMTCSKSQVYSTLYCHQSITSGLSDTANRRVGGRPVAKGEVWLNLRVAAIQQQWLK